MATEKVPTSPQEQAVEHFVKYLSTQLKDIRRQHWFAFTMDCMKLVRTYIEKGSHSHSSSIATQTLGHSASDSDTLTVPATPTPMLPFGMIQPCRPTPHRTASNPAYPWSSANPTIALPQSGVMSTGGSLYIPSASSMYQQSTNPYFAASPAAILSALGSPFPAQNTSQHIQMSASPAPSPAPPTTTRPSTIPTTTVATSDDSSQPDDVMHLNPDIFE